MCRGIGTCYIELLVSDIDGSHVLEVTARTSEGNAIPLQQHEGNAPQGYQCQIVCLIPYLQASGVELICRELDEHGTYVAEDTQTVSYSKIKWASRYNYRLKATRTKQVRNVCDRVDYRYPQIAPTFFLWNGSPHVIDRPEYILKALIRIPSADESVTIQMLDGFGRPVNEWVVASSTFYAMYPDELWGQKIFEAGFSTRIPEDGSTYCLVARSSKSGLLGFLNIDEEAMSYLSAAYNWSFYKIASNDYYHRALDSGILGSQSTTFIEQPQLKAGLFSIVVPLYNTPLRFLREMIESVVHQAYQDWELLLVNASPENTELAQVLSELDDTRMRVLEVSENKGIAENTNVGIKSAKGDYIFLLDHDDVLDPWALYEYAQAIIEDPSIDILYSDEDFFDDVQGFTNPHLKSDFNIDLLRCHNYVTHFLAMRASLMKDLMLDPAYDAAQDYDLILRAVEKTRAIKHIPHILYHWRMHDLSTSQNHEAKPEAAEHGRRALQAHLDRCNIKARVELTEYPYVYRTVYEVEGDPLVSIIIPNKDNSDVLRRCIDSIEGKSTYRNYEIIVIENNSVEEKTFEFYKNLQQEYSNVKVVTWEHEFNYSKINNFGAQFAKGEYLLLLNNDTEVINPDWLESMVSLCQRQDVGIVGAKLLFPDDTVQHAGVVMMYCPNPSASGGPAHIFTGLDRDDACYFDRAILKQDLSAVTGACLMTKRALYEELGGLSEDFAVSYNDVDYCLRVREKNLLVVFDPDALLYHYESLTRGLDTSTSGKSNYKRFVSEQGLLRQRFPRYYVDGDPYHSKYCTLYM